MNKRKRMVAGALLIVFAGVGVLSVINEPRLQTLRTVDLVRLLGIGACFGVAFALILGRLSKE